MNIKEINEAVDNAISLDEFGEDGQIYLTKVLTMNELTLAIDHAFSIDEQERKTYLQETKKIKLVLDRANKSIDTNKI